MLSFCKNFTFSSVCGRGKVAAARVHLLATDGPNTTVLDIGIAPSSSRGKLRARGQVWSVQGCVHTWIQVCIACGVVCMVCNVVYDVVYGVVCVVYVVLCVWCMLYGVVCVMYVVWCMCGVCSVVWYM